jgi:hypothetical protein
MRVNPKTDWIAATAVSIFCGLLRRTAAGWAGGSATIVAGILCLHAPAVYGQQSYTYTLSMVTALDSSTLGNCVGTGSGQSSSPTVNVSFSGNCTNGFSASVKGSIQFPSSVTLGSDVSFSATATATMSGVPPNIAAINDPYIIMQVASNANYLVGTQDYSKCSSNGVRSQTTSTATSSCAITSTDPNQNPGTSPPDRIAIQVRMVWKFDLLALALACCNHQRLAIMS